MGIAIKKTINTLERITPTNSSCNNAYIVFMGTSSQTTKTETDANICAEGFYVLYNDIIKM